jgi:hypothetical protein
MTDRSSYSVLGDRIVLFKNAIKHPEVLISMADAAGWRDNTNDDYEDGLIHRYESDITVSSSTESEKTILLELDGAMRTYAELVSAPVSSSHHYVGLEWLGHISKYTKGGVATSHTDEDIHDDNGMCTVIVYLNEGYEGGEVGFDDFDVEIKPSSGDILIFPCHYYHYGAEVLSDYKYMSIFRHDFNN